MDARPTGCTSSAPAAAPHPRATDVQQRRRWTRWGERTATAPAKTGAPALCGSEGAGRLHDLHRHLMEDLEHFHATAGRTQRARRSGLTRRHGLVRWQSQGAGLRVGTFQQCAERHLQRPAHGGCVTDGQPLLAGLDGEDRRV